ncbi:MAG TPA: hypothetical protein VK419_16710, partial [Bryobacteraceae bacterium]|nr:hypothetical protein [Bryobacteraceae bacterium]
RNQHLGRDAKFPSVELLNAGDVLRRLSLQTLVQVTAVVDPPDLAQLVGRMGVQPASLASDRVCEQRLGSQARRRNFLSLEEFLSLEKSRAEVRITPPRPALSAFRFDNTA